MPHTRISYFQVDRFCDISVNEISLLNKSLTPDLAAVTSREKSHVSKPIKVDRCCKISLFQESITSNLTGTDFRSHISDSKSITVDRYGETSIFHESITPNLTEPDFRSHISESKSIDVERWSKTSLFHEPLKSNLAEPDFRSHISESKSIDVVRCSKISLFHEPLKSNLTEPDFRSHISESKSIEVDRCSEISFEISLQKDPLVSDPQVTTEPVSQAHISETPDSRVDRYRKIPLREISPNLPLITDSREPPSEKRCREALKRRRMLDKAVQTDPWTGGSEADLLNFIEVCPERGVADEYAEQVACSPGPDDTLQLVETSVGEIAPDGFGCGSGDGVPKAHSEGIDLLGPAFRWNDRELPQGGSSLASNKRMRLRLGLSKRARPPSLHRNRPTLRF